MISLRIAHISSPDFLLTREYGGSESLICNLAEKQVSEGHDVTIVSAPSGCDTFLHPVSLVKPIEKCSNWLLNWTMLRVNGAKHVYKSFKWLDSNVDIIHNHLSEEGIALSFLRKVPCLNTLHGTAHERLPQHIITRLYSLTRNTKLVALSRSSYNQHKKFYGKDLIGYIHSGINTELFRFNPNVIKKSEVEICFTGRISPDKSVKEIIRIADIIHNHGIDVHLKIVGKFEQRDFHYFQEVVQMINERGYISKFINAPRSLVKEIVGNSDVFVFPISKTEPFALAPLEAMSCGTPVVSLRRAAIVDYVEDGLNGFLCDNISQMADAILKYKEINRRKCREIVEQNFSIDVLYRRYMKMYEKVIELD